MALEQRTEQSTDTTLEQQVYAFGTQFSEMEKLTSNHAINSRTAIEHLMRAVGQMVEEKKAMRERLDRAEERARNMEARRNGVRAGNDDAALRAENEQLRDERERLENQLKEAQNELELAKNRNDVLFREFESLDRVRHHSQTTATPPRPNSSFNDDVPLLTPQIVTEPQSTPGKAKQVRRSTRICTRKTWLTKQTTSSSQSVASAIKYCDTCKQSYASDNMPRHFRTQAHKNVQEFIASNDEIQIYKPGKGSGIKQKDGLLLGKNKKRVAVKREQDEEME